MNGDIPIIDIHQKRNYYVIPVNNLGQDIFIRATEIRGLQNIIKMPSGGMKPLKVPVLKNMLDAHFKGILCKKLRTMVSVMITEAEVIFVTCILLFVKMLPENVKLLFGVASSNLFLFGV